MSRHAHRKRDELLAATPVGAAFLAYERARSAAHNLDVRIERSNPSLSLMRKSDDAEKAARAAREALINLILAPRP